MTYNTKTRERCFRDILVDMKSRLEMENDNNLKIEFEDCDVLKDTEFRYKFTIKIPKDNRTSEAYDNFISLKDFASNMFNYLINHEFVETTVFTENDKIEFDFVGRTKPLIF